MTATKTYLITVTYEAQYTNEVNRLRVRLNERGWLESLFSRYKGTNPKIVKIEEASTQ